jgi:outer membrane biosynthesis protein TonB
MRAVSRRKELERDTFGTDRIATTMSSGNQGVSKDGAFVSANTGNFEEALGLFAPEATSVVDAAVDAPAGEHSVANRFDSPVSRSQPADPIGQSENALRSLRERLISVDAEASRRAPLVRRINAVRDATTRSAFAAGAIVASRIRYHLVQHPKLPRGAVSIACILIAALVVRYLVGGMGTPPAPAGVANVASDYSVDSSAITKASIPAPRTEVEPVRGSNELRSAPAVRRAVPELKIATKPAQEARRPDAPLNGIRRDVSTSRRSVAAQPDTSESSSPAAAATVPDARQAPPLLSSTLDPREIIENDASSNVVYSDRDRDVRPPQLIDSELPRPTVAGWRTDTNTIELIVSEDGSVEHVKLLTAPQRMTDVMLLSRAKLWKFAPALKDGQPVRYRVVMTWEVNP